MELFTPEFGLIFWMFVAFAVLFFVLAKWGWPAIMKSVEGRADLIDKGVEYAQNAKEQLDHAREEADKYIDEARKQRHRVAVCWQSAGHHRQAAAQRIAADLQLAG